MASEAPAFRAEITDLQKKTAQAMVNIFETSRIQGDYGMITLLAGDSGHLTYGRSQTTLASGNLFLLVKAYREATEAQFAEPLQPFLGRLSQRDLTLDLDLDFRRIVKEAATDPVMQNAQDKFFDRVYWIPALQTALGARALPGPVDGIYGPMTVARVRQFQLQNGLQADGMVGPATRAALGLD